MKILVGALAADQGGVTRIGRIGYCPQVPQVYGRLTCDDHVELFGAAYGLSPAQAHASAERLYEALGFGRFADTRADELSGGTLAKLNLRSRCWLTRRCCYLTSRTPGSTSTPT